MIRSLRHRIRRSPVTYWIFPFIVLFPFMLQVSTDNLYMIATGEYIIKHGIPKTNPFAVVNGLDIVIQNWLYCVLQYLVSRKIGLTGIQLLSVVQYLIFLPTCFYLQKKRNCANLQAGTFTLYSGVIMITVMGAARPAVLTFCLLLCVIISLERYSEGTHRGSAAILVLPGTCVLCANLQSSNLVFFFCPVLAYLAAGYIVYSGDAKLKKKQDIHEEKKEMVHSAWFMIGLVGIALALSCVLNPYGVDGALYLFRSYGHVSADELLPISLFSWNGFLSVGSLFLMGIVIQGWKPRILSGGTTDYYHLFLLLGFGVLSLTCIRNLLFWIPALFLSWKEVCRLFCPVKMIMKAFPSIKHAFLHSGVLARIAAGLLAVFFISIWGENLKIIRPGIIDTQISRYQDGDLVLKMKEAGMAFDGKREFPGSPVMMLYGAKVIMEPRQEIYDRPINHKEDLREEYEFLGNEAGKEEIDDFFKTHTFDYYLAQKGSKLDLYFQMSGTYERTFEENQVVLYLPKGGT